MTSTATRTGTRTGARGGRSTTTEYDAALATGEARRASRRQRRYFALNGAAMVAIAGVALSVIGILYLIQTSHVASLGYRLSALQNQRDALAIDNARLGYDIAKYESLDTVNDVATKKLGMVPLTKDAFLDVQAPAQAQLAPLPPDARQPESLWQRVVHAITGVGQAQSPAHGEPALPNSFEEPASGNGK